MSPRGRVFVKCTIKLVSSSTLYMWSAGPVLELRIAAFVWWDIDSGVDVGLGTVANNIPHWCFSQ